MKFFHKHVHYLLIIIIAVLSIQYFGYETPIPRADALRYIEYAVNLEQSERFGILRDDSGGVVPGNANAPFYPMFIALNMKLDLSLKESLICLIENKKNDSSCPHNYMFFSYVQNIFIIITLVFIFLSARYLFDDKNILPIIAVISALFSGELHYYANQFLTEALIFPVFSGYIYFLMRAVNEKSMKYLFVSSFLLGGMTLIRPEYIYWFYVKMMFLIFMSIYLYKLSAYKYIFVAMVGYSCLILPWVARNHLVLDELNITSGYGDVVLAQRVAYNHMSWKEWGVSFIYWLPDFGDSLAEKLFREELYSKLTFEAGDTYYSGKSAEIISNGMESVEHRSELLGYLIQNEVISKPIKHILVSLPLMVRGMFVAKYWGLVAFICLLIMFIRMSNCKLTCLIIYALPALFMAIFYAFVTVSIPRYNLLMISIYSISLAYVLDLIVLKFFKKN